MIAATIARLKAIAPAPFALVQGAAELAALKRDTLPMAVPAAFVLPLAEDAEASDMANVLRQRVEADIGILLVTRADLSDATGAAALGGLGALRQALRDHVLGWPPLAGHAPFQFSGGQIAVFAAGAVWWQDNFTTSFRLRKP